MSRYLSDRHASMSKKERAQLVRELVMINHNPLLNEQKWEALDRISHYKQIAREAWGNHEIYPEEGPLEYRLFWAENIAPLLEELKKIRSMLFCWHELVEEGAERDICRKCGAVNYGRGWKFEDCK